MKKLLALFFLLITKLSATVYLEPTPQFKPCVEIATVYIEYNEKNHFVYHAFRTQLQGNPESVRINFDEHKGFTWVTPADALKMDLLLDEDACIMKDYFLK